MGVTPGLGEFARDHGPCRTAEIGGVELAELEDVATHG